MSSGRSRPRTWRSPTRRDLAATSASSCTPPPLKVVHRENLHLTRLVHVAERTSPRTRSTSRRRASRSPCRRSSASWPAGGQTSWAAAGSPKWCVLARSLAPPLSADISLRALPPHQTYESSGILGKMFRMVENEPTFERHTEIRLHPVLGALEVRAVLQHESSSGLTPRSLDAPGPKQLPWRRLADEARVRARRRRL
jgi:hypothetical protein